jgi:hypothetical protein
MIHCGTMSLSIKAGSSQMMRRPIVIVWDNFGFMHNDRCAALAKYYLGRRDVVGIEIAGSSDTYRESTVSFCDPRCKRLDAIASNPFVHSSVSSARRWCSILPSAFGFLEVIQ